MVRENTQNLVGKSEGIKPSRKYLAVGGRIIINCILMNRVLGYELDSSVSG
jgi:hypothetical protein